MSLTQTNMTVPFMDLTRQHEPLMDDFRAAFERVVGASAFILGEEVERFERRFAEFCGVRHCIGVGSGTAALILMLQAAGVGPGDEVIVPAHTFIATALAVRHAGAVPVCVEVEAGTGLIDPAAAAAAVTSRTAAILAVHLYGQACAMDALRALATRHGLLLLEDAAQAQGATLSGRRAGALGTAGAFSFYPSKNLGALGDAGAITTDDDGIAERARKLRDLGRLRGPIHELAGYNERLDGMQAALLSVKLDHLTGWNDARRRHADAYREGLQDVELVHERAESPSIYHLFPIRVADRDGLAGALAGYGVASGVHYARSLADQPALPELHGADVPVARDWARRELSLPLFPELRDDEIEAVVNAVKSGLESAQAA
jgi:dTDP-4-amino-4,6-dideoxygalactose transaminase